MQLSGIDTVFFWVSDLDRAVAWYRDHLGGTPGPRHGDWQTVDLGGGATFGLHQGAPSGNGGATPAFRVDDLDAAIAELAAAGIDPVGDATTDTGAARFRTFTDPDGNVFQLIERT